MTLLERKLKESEEKYRTLTEQSFLGISILQDDVIQYVNKQLAYLFGYTTEEIMAWGKGGFLNVIYPDDRQKVAEQARKKQQGESDFLPQYQFRGIKKNGDVIWLELFSKTITYKGKPADFVTIHDITDKKIAEQKIKESEEKYRSLFENMNFGFAYHKLIVDEKNKPIDYEYIEVNPAFEKLTGLNAEDMIGKKVTEILPGTENDPADWIGKFGSVALTGVPLIVEDYSEALDRWYKVAGYSPEKGYFAVTFTDITDQKKAEITIAESEEKYRSLFNNSPFAIVLFTTKGIILDCNDATNLITGYSREELVGNNFKDFNFYSDTTSANIGKRESQIKKGKIPGAREILLHKKDGSQFWARSQIKFVKLQKQTYIQAIIQDITERKNIEKQLSDLAKFPSENPNPVLRVNKEEILYSNKAGRDLLGLTEKSKIPDIFEDTIIKAFKENTIKTLEVEFDDEYYSFTITPIILEGYANVYGKNVTERKISEIALNLEKKFADDILNSSTDTIFVFNPETSKAVRWNNGFSEASDYTDKEISKLKTPDSYYSKEDLERAAEATKDIMTTGKTTVEMSLITKDGRKIPYEYTGTSLEDSDGNLLIVSVGRDLTERKEAEQKRKLAQEKLKHSHERLKELETIINNSPGVLFLWKNAEGWPVEFVSENVSQWGYAPEDFYSGNVIYAKIIHTDDLERVAEEVDHYSNEDINEFVQVYRILTKSGEVKWIDDRTWIRRDSEGNITHFQGIALDITDSKIAEDALKESEKKFKAAYDKASFYKDIFTHDINNILQVVNSSAELISYQLGDSEKSQDIANISEIIKKQVERGSKLVSNVRTLSRLDEEQIPTKNLEISRFLENSIDFVGKAYEERNVKINIEGLKGKFKLNANELIQDVFENILINSIKYNENSTIEITVRISKLKIDKKNHIKIEFLDNGIGVPDSRKEAIFLSGNRELKGSKGMGLGLSLVSKIIQVFNGKIWVEDKVNGDYTQGSNFILVLPEAK